MGGKPRIRSRRYYATVDAISRDVLEPEDGYDDYTSIAIGIWDGNAGLPHLVLNDGKPSLWEQGDGRRIGTIYESDWDLFFDVKAIELRTDKVYEITVSTAVLGTNGGYKP